jgi:SP family facilitated glucose transporter-like MFS transporter 3
MVTQGMGFGLATPRQWRLVLFISSGISIFQYFTAPFVVESPSYLNRKGLVNQEKLAICRLWGEFHDVSRTDREQILTCRDKNLISSLVEEQESEEPLLPDSDDTTERVSTDRQPAMTIPRLFASTELRRPLLTIIAAMTSQQISGINAGKQNTDLHSMTFLNVPQSCTTVTIYSLNPSPNWHHMFRWQSRLSTFS